MSLLFDAKFGHYHVVFEFLFQMRLEAVFSLKCSHTKALNESFRI